MSSGETKRYEPAWLLRGYFTAGLFLAQEVGRPLFESRTPAPVTVGLFLMQLHVDHMAAVLDLMTGDDHGER